MRTKNKLKALEGKCEMVYPMGGKETKMLH